MSTDLSHLTERRPLRIGKRKYHHMGPCALGLSLKALRRDRWVCIGDRAKDCPLGEDLTWTYIGKFAEVLDNGREGPELYEFHTMLEDGRAITVHKATPEGRWLLLAKLAVNPKPMQRTWRARRLPENRGVLEAAE